MAPLDLPRATPGVNPILADYHDELVSQTGLHKIGSRTHSVVGHGGNINFIEGLEGTVVVNTGTTLLMSAQALALYREISDSPIAALIYTHGYNDHTGGARIFVDDAGGKSVPVYANAAWHGFIEQGISPLLPEVALRAGSQVGWLLPPGAEGTVGNGLTGPLRGGGAGSYVAPTVDVAERTLIRIAGVELELIPAPHDLDDGLIVWIPDERILFGGDLLLLNDIYPTLATPRTEPRRDPQAWIDSMGIAASLRPAHIINAYGPPVSGEAEVYERLSGQQRISQFIVDQVHRRLLAGEEADDIAAQLKLPDVVTQGRSYREIYHRLAWIVRSLVAREFGHFGGNVEEFCRLPPEEDAARMIDAMGGLETVIERAAAAYRGDDCRWALRLATIALKAFPGDERALAIRHEGMRAIAFATDSANERNYLLTSVALETGALNREDLLRQIRGSSPSDISLRKPPRHWLGVLGRKIIVDCTGNRHDLSIEFRLTDRIEVLSATLQAGVLLRQGQVGRPSAKIELSLDYPDFIRGVEGMEDFDTLRAEGRLRIEGREEDFRLFQDAFRW